MRVAPVKHMHAHSHVDVACGKAVFPRISDVPTRFTFMLVYMRTMTSYIWRILCSRMKGNNELVLKFAKLSDKALAPTKGSEYAAGYDLRSAYKYIIPAHGKELVKTDLQIQVPPGTYGRIAPRSGLAWKNHIDVGAGVIDADYRGNLGVVLFNHSSDDFEIAPGDRVAQLICEKITYPKIEEVEFLNDTNRGAGGFGSTGIQ